MNPSVTYTGEEVALVAGFIALCLPTLDESDFEVADLLLDKALAGWGADLPPDLAAKIAVQRVRPLDRFAQRLTETYRPGVRITTADAAITAGIGAGNAFVYLNQLALHRRVVAADGLTHWRIIETEDSNATP